jgi:hypothetical protein
VPAEQCTYIDVHKYSCSACTRIGRRGSKQVNTAHGPTGCTWRDVAVSNGGHCDDTPPARLRYRYKLGVRVVLEHRHVRMLSTFPHTFSKKYNTVLKNMMPVNRNMPNMDSSRALRAIVSPNVCSPRLYRASLKTRATRNTRSTRITSMAPVS